MITVYVAAYLFSIGVSIYVFTKSWLLHQDVNISDLILFCWFSIFGPFSLFIALFVYAIEYAQIKTRNKIVFKRKGLK